MGHLPKEIADRMALARLISLFVTCFLVLIVLQLLALFGRLRDNERIKEMATETKSQTELQLEAARKAGPNGGRAALEERFYTPITPQMDTLELAQEFDRVILLHGNKSEPKISWVLSEDQHAGWVIGVAVRSKGYFERLER